MLACYMIICDNLKTILTGFSFRYIQEIEINLKICG